MRAEKKKVGKGFVPTVINHDVSGRQQDMKVSVLHERSFIFVSQMGKAFALNVSN